MKKKRILIGTVILVVVAAAVVVLFFGNGKAADTSYRTTKLERGDLDVLVSATGTLSAVKTVEVGTQVSGIISKLYVDFNSVVRKGQIIAMIDTTFLAASVEDAEANVERSKAQVFQTKRDLDRMKPLFDRGLAAQSDLDQSQSSYEQAMAGLKSAKAQYNRAVINLNYATIRAPIDGVVINRAVDVGQTVAASFSAPTIYSIANDLTKMQVLATIDETDIGTVVDGQEVTFTVDAYPDRIFKGKVSQIRLQPQTVQNVVNYTVVIEVPNPDLKLMPGMTATVNILTAHKSDVLRVPNVALRFQPSAEESKAALEELQKQFGSRDSASSGNPHQDSLRAMFRQRFSQMMNGGSQRPGQGQGGGQGFGGQGFSGQGPGRSGSRLWYLDEKKNLHVAFIRSGLTNGTYTEIIPGPRSQIKEGMEVILGVNLVSSKPTASPLGGQQQMRGPGGGGMRGF